MSGQIKKPVNQKLLTNVAVVRIKKNGKRFEIACYKNKVVNWRNKSEKNIDEVLQTENVFINVSKGQLAKKDDLLSCFGTENQLEICQLILEKGELQVSEKERQVTTETSLKAIANLIANMCVNVETQRPFSVAVIEKALKDIGFSYKTNHSVKQHALEGIKQLSKSMKIERAKMRLRVFIPAKNATSLHNRLKEYFDKIEDEDWEKGDLTMIGLADPGHYKTLIELVSKDNKSPGEVELLSLKVINDNVVEL